MQKEWTNIDLNAKGIIKQLLTLFLGYMRQLFFHYLFLQQTSKFFRIGGKKTKNKNLKSSD